MNRYAWLVVFFILCGCMAAYATTITLTQSQVDAVLADNPQECPPVEECPEPPVEPPIEPPVPPEECEDSTDTATIKSWNQVFIGAFPYPTYQNVTYQTVPRNGYYAIQFNTRDVIDDGKLSLLENPATPGIRYTSISECKGNFDTVSSCRKDYGLGGGMWWATNRRADACRLEANTTYYFNVTFVNPDTGNSNCSNSPCYVNIQYTNL